MNEEMPARACRISRASVRAMLRYGEGEDEGEGEAAASAAMAGRAAASQTAT